MWPTGYSLLNSGLTGHYQCVHREQTQSLIQRQLREMWSQHDETEGESFLWECFVTHDEELFEGTLQSESCIISKQRKWVVGGGSRERNQCNHRGIKLET